MKKVIFNESIVINGKDHGRLTITEHEGKYLEVEIKLGLLGFRRFFFGIRKTTAA